MVGFGFPSPLPASMIVCSDRKVKVMVGSHKNEPSGLRRVPLGTQSMLDLHPQLQAVYWKDSS